MCTAFGRTYYKIKKILNKLKVGQLRMKKSTVKGLKLKLLIQFQAANDKNFYYMYMLSMKNKHL